MFKQDVIILGKSGDETRRLEKFGNGYKEFETDWTFQVLKDAPVGHGLALPDIYDVFRTLAQTESMDVGEWLAGFKSRRFLTLHTKGHEAKAGPNASRRVTNVKEGEATGSEKKFFGLSGDAEMVLNFDHKISNHFVDPKAFDSNKYNSPLLRLMRWGGPLAQMVAARGVTPYLMPILKVQANDARGLVGPFLETLISEFYRPPTPQTVSWNDRCFSESRVFSEMLRWGVQQSLVSYQTATKEMGFSYSDEMNNKRALLGEDPALLRPPFDQAHGDKQPQKGRPTGTPDPPGGNARQES